MKQTIFIFIFIAFSVKGHAQYAGKAAGIDSISSNNSNVWQNTSYNYCYINNNILYDTNIVLSTNQSEIIIVLKNENHQFKIRDMIDYDDSVFVYTTNKDIWLKLYNYIDDHEKYNDDILLFINKNEYILTNTKRNNF